ncbi:MAG: CDP-alcohol phosphatidyltransferase [Betaproteobacteria bacterium]|nr:CDP-alcohol phosphatidyltransferase [Betaproteobacteria bacterium]
MTKQLPNFFTLLNLFFGCLAIVCGLQSGIILSVRPEGSLYFDVPEKIWMASLFIGLAAVVDFLDGFLARAFKADSAMGKQLDSLADLVSFGVAPALLVYHFLRLGWAHEPAAMELDSVLLWPAFFLPLAAAWRLARFNLQPSSLAVFTGLPVPAAGLFFASLPLAYWHVDQDWIVSLLLNVYFLYALIALFCYLMVSRLPLLTLKFTSFDWATNRPRYLLLVFSVVSILFLQWLALPIIIILYVLLSLLFKNQLA